MRIARSLGIAAKILGNGDHDKYTNTQIHKYICASSLDIVVKTSGGFSTIARMANTVQNDWVSDENDEAFPPNKTTGSTA